MRLSDRREPVINRHLECTCDMDCASVAAASVASELNLYSEQCYKGSKCLQNIHVRSITYHNEHKMKSSTRCLRQVADKYDMFDI